MADSYIIASSRPWNKNLQSELCSIVEGKFHLLSSPEDLTEACLSELKPRYVFFPHWSHIIPASIFRNFECVIFHMTDLPFGRGGSPLQNLIAAGIYETKISAIKCVAEVDAGPVYLKQSLALYGSAEEIYLRASEVIQSMIIEIVRTNVVPNEQVGVPSFFKRRRPEQGSLLNAKSLKQAFDQIRMLDAEGYPHAFIDIGDFRLEFSRVSRKVDYLLADVKIKLTPQRKEDDK